MLVTLDSVSKIFGSRLVFKNLSLALPPGRVLLLAGPNGAGKSTLLRIIVGLARPTTGTATLGPDLDKVGYLGHNTFIYPELSALENLRFWSGLYGLKASEADLLAALERMELAPYAQERAGTFSRGMSQRLSLARVLLHAPDLLLLDEPGTGLDVRSMDILRREIRAAKERGAGLVWVSHQLEHDLALADEVLYLRSKTKHELCAAPDFRLEPCAEAAQ